MAKDAGGELGEAEDQIGAETDEGGAEGSLESLGQRA